MKLTKEQIENLKSASSAEEISAKLGNFVTPEQAARIYSVVKGKEALSDEELTNIAGGCGEPHNCPECGTPMVWDDDSTGKFTGWYCNKCKRYYYD